MATYTMQAASLSGVVVPSSLKMSSSSSITGQRLAMPSSMSRITCMATSPTPLEVSQKEAPDAPEGWTPPELNPNTPSPIFGGSTGGLMRKAQIEEFHAITWESPKEQIFEMPTGGAAVMRAGPNLLKLSRKEQCLCLGRQLRGKFKINYQIYRIFPSGEVQYLHPKDGVYPEKVNAGRKGVNVNLRPIGKNPNPAALKFSGGKTPYNVD